jgi:hypothetical protein
VNIKYLLKCKLIPLLLVLVLFIAVLPPASGASFVAVSEAVDVLGALGIFKGDDNGPGLDRALAKQEALTLIVRLAGLEAAAQTDEGSSCPFSDVSPWARGYVSQAVQSKLALGLGNGLLGASDQTNAQVFLTFTLRVLGYSDSTGDFTYANAVGFAEEIGLVGSEYADASHAFLREDAVLISYNALITPRKGTTEKLIEYLIRTGAIRRSALLNTKLSGYANYGKRIYSAAEIYERTSSATFFLATYADEKKRDEGVISGTASGFFISPDGLAVTCYHAIELEPFARITTTDGKVYEDIRVLYTDGYRDIAVLQVGKTAVDGASVRSFPYITVGDSDALAAGSTVVTVSSPAGFQDCLSEGKISTKSRIADDPAYPLIQFTAPISAGSSGGALINEYCEVVGVLMGTFTAGNDLNLAVPINALRNLSYPSSGMTLQEVCALDLERNLNATLTVSQTNLTIGVDEKAEIIVTRDSPGTVGLIYNIQDTGIVSCAWGSFNTKQTIPITITGLSRGTTVVTISYYNGTGNPEAKAAITVTVA